MADRQLAGRILKPAPNNFVERPWGGTRLREFKTLCPLPDQIELTGSGIGESFEIAAFDADEEAARYPSRVRTTAGWMPLTQLVRDHGETLLGERWISRYGRSIPLLPKFLNVRELLSVQGHPPGHTEAYIVISADPGATIRLGFRRDIKAADFHRTLEAGLQAQRDLVALLGEDSPWFAVQRLLAQWFSDRGKESADMLASLSETCQNAMTGRAGVRVRNLLEALKVTYWFVLDSMNEVPLEPGQVIHNTNPQRIVDLHSRQPAAEVHALGNPLKREFVMLEIRRPGPTLRAWDNVRFPLRDVDIGAALKVLNLQATAAEEFTCSRAPLETERHSLSVESPYFRIEHVDLSGGDSVSLGSDRAHCLHMLAGSADLETDEGLVELRAGESAFVPFGVGSFRATASAQGMQLVRVFLP